MDRDPDQLRAFALRDRSAVDDLRAEHWKTEAERRGVVAALRMGEALRRRYQQRHPEWPTEQDREADLAVHRRVSQALQSVRHPRG